MLFLHPDVILHVRGICSLGGGDSAWSSEGPKMGEAMQPSGEEAFRASFSTVDSVHSEYPWPWLDVALLSSGLLWLPPLGAK